MGTKAKYLAIAGSFVAAALILTGCASTATSAVGTHSPTANPQSIPTADPLAPDSSARYLKIPTTSAVIVPKDEIASLDSLPWKFLSISPDRRSIQVAYVAGGGCETPVGFEVVSSNAAVTVTALSRDVKTASACAANLEIGRSTVPLPTRLAAGIQLIHSPVASGWTSPNMLP